MSVFELDADDYFEHDEENVRLIYESYRKLDIARRRAKALSNKNDNIQPFPKWHEAGESLRESWRARSRLFMCAPLLSPTEKDAQEIIAQQIYARSPWIRSVKSESGRIEVYEVSWSELLKLQCMESALARTHYETAMGVARSAIRNLSVAGLEIKPTEISA